MAFDIATEKKSKLKFIRRLENYPGFLKPVRMNSCLLGCSGISSSGRLLKSLSLTYSLK